jgi:hypothetical protein
LLVSTRNIQIKDNIKAEEERNVFIANQLAKAYKGSHNMYVYLFELILIHWHLKNSREAEQLLYDEMLRRRMAESENKRMEDEIRKLKHMIEQYAEALAKGRQLTFSQHDPGDLLLIEEQKKEIASLKKQVKYLEYDIEELQVINLKAKRRNEMLERDVL